MADTLVRHSYHNGQRSRLELKTWGLNSRPAVLVGRSAISFGKGLWAPRQRSQRNGTASPLAPCCRTPCKVPRADSAPMRCFSGERKGASGWAMFYVLFVR